MDHVLKLVTYANLMTILESLPASYTKYDEIMTKTETSQIKLTQGDALLLAPQLRKLNHPLRIGQSTTMFQTRDFKMEKNRKKIDEKSPNRKHLKYNFPSNRKYIFFEN